MPETSQAAVLVGKRQVEFHEMTIPVGGPGTGLLQIEVSGVCGADWPRYTGERMGDVALPVILGHEIVGRIVALGEALASRLEARVGDRVLLEEPRPCGKCRFCLEADYQSCSAARYGGTPIAIEPGLWGGYAEYVYLDDRSIVHKVPVLGGDETPNDALSLWPLAIPISNGLYWVGGAGNLKAGSVLVIQGPGQHGLGCVVAGRELGASCIVVVGRPGDERRLSVAKDLGADGVVVDTDGTEITVCDRIRSITGGRLGDVVVQAAGGSAGLLSMSLALCETKGRLVNAGFLTGNVELKPDLIITNQLSLVGVRGRPSRYIDTALQVIATRRHPLESMLTHVFSLEETDKALRTVGRELDAGSAIHVSISPSKNIPHYRRNRVGGRHIANRDG